MTIVRTQTPSGEAIVILPEAEFERLVELAQDGDDARTIAASRGRLDRGEDELLTLDDLDRLRAAATPLAFWREKRGVTVPALSGLTGIDEGFLTALERDGHMGDPATYRKLAMALAIDVEDLLDADDE